MIKRILALVLALALGLTIVGCGGSKDGGTNKKPSGPTDSEGTNFQRIITAGIGDAIIYGGDVISSIEAQRGSLTRTIVNAMSMAK